jgi:hypothetical protein
MDEWSRYLSGQVHAIEPIQAFLDPDLGRLAMALESHETQQSQQFARFRLANIASE